MDSAPTKRLAVYKFASCDGCQLSILDLEDELLSLAQHVEIAYFPEATRKHLPGPYDITLVEGSITTPEDLKRIVEVRHDSRFLVTIGACATSGGIQALRNFAKVEEYKSIVYPRPDYIDTLATSTPIQEHVKVDYELRGCPVNKHQLLELVSALLHERSPNIYRDSVCTECKAKHNLCILVAEKKPCLGPITHAGCGALCPSYKRGCYGCFGPKTHANPKQLMEQLITLGIRPKDCLHLLRTFNTWSEPFKQESMRWQTKAHESEQ